MAPKSTAGLKGRGLDDWTAPELSTVRACTLPACDLTEGLNTGGGGGKRDWYLTGTAGMGLLVACTAPTPADCGAACLVLLLSVLPVLFCPVKGMRTGSSGTEDTG